MSSFRITPHLQASFRAIGADVRAVPPLAPPVGWRGRELAAQRIRVRDSLFELVLPTNASATVLDCSRAERHLVLNLQDLGAASQRFLCGFDERHWFVAAVTGLTVRTAKESLMPPQVRDAALRAGLRGSELYRRRTAVFLRQGEWFFVPVETRVDPLHVHHNEPLIRPGGGKPHLVQELVRGRGEQVWHHHEHAPNGLRDAEYAALPEHRRRDKGWNRRMRVTDATSVLARGTVRHPDHATIHLAGWHRVYINSEVRPASLGFLD